MGLTEMEFTGERVVPGKTPSTIYREHTDRYEFASKYTIDKRVLDIACGTGYGIDMMLKGGAGEAVGVDISIDSVKYAKDWYGDDRRTRFICADGICLPFLDDVFDIITSFETIEHIKKYDKLVEEFYRILKPNGLLICSTPNKRIFSPNHEKSLNVFHVREFWPDEFRQLLQKRFPDTMLYGQCDVTLADKTVERDRGVHDFINNEMITSGYVIAVARKAVKSLL